MDLVGEFFELEGLLKPNKFELTCGICKIPVVTNITIGVVMKFMIVKSHARESKSVEVLTKVVATTLEQISKKI